MKNIRGFEMKKFFLAFVILLFPFYLYGADLDAQYKEGFSAYKAKNFERSYDIFSKLYISKLSNAKVNFYLGRSAYETGHYEVALAAFERVEMLDSGNLRNKLEMARTYFMLKMYKDAQNKFQEVLNNPNLPQNVRTNIEMYLAKVKNVQSRSFTYATINLDWLYDSNVNYGSLESTYDISTGTMPSASEKSDRAFQLYANVVNVYDFGSSGGYAFKNRVKLFLKDYKKLDDYDVQYLAYNPSVLYKNTKYLAEFIVGLDVMTLSKREYLRTVSFSPRFEYNHLNTLRSIVSFKYQTKYFTQKAQSGLNSHHYEVDYSLQDIISPRSYVQAGLIGIREQKLHGKRIDVDYDEYRVNLAYANQFSAVYGMEAFGQYRRRNYKDHSTLFDSTRYDDAGTLSVALNARILQTLRFHIKGGYDRVESNQKVFSYEKYTLTIGLNKTF